MKVMTGYSTDRVEDVDFVRGHEVVRVDFLCQGFVLEQIL